MSSYQKENDLIKGYLNRVRKGNIVFNKLMLEQRDVDTSEVRDEIKKFQDYFRSKGINANFQFGNPQKFDIQKDGILWSGKINDIIEWYFNATINTNERYVQIVINRQSPMILEDENIEILKELKTYFEIFTDEWISKEYNKDSEEQVS